jgi:peptidoglycan/LPS O-acetylase OafA/YrhL
MTAAVEPRVNLPALTGIRGVAAWFVVLYHIRGGAASQLPPEVIAVLAKGYLAVDLFFMLSGFVLWLNYSERLRGGGLAATANFLGSRIARIWPLHAVILGCAAAFALLLTVVGRPNAVQFPWGEFPLHLLMIQNWGFTDQLSWNDPAWSISCEFAAYLLFPLLVLATDWRAFSSAVLVGLLGLFALLLHLGMTTGGATILGANIPRLGLIRVFCEFGMGTLICAIWARWRSAPRPALLVSLCAATAFFLLTISGILEETLGVPLFLASLLLLVSLTATGAANPLASRWVHYLGEISYATYLVHYLLFILFKLLFVDDVERIPLPLLALFLAMTFAASVALHHGVERPAQRALKRRLTTSKLPPVESVPGHT